VADVCPGLVDTAASRPWFDDMSTAQTPAEAAGLPRLGVDSVRPETYGELVQSAHGAETDPPRGPASPPRWWTRLRRSVGYGSQPGVIRGRDASTACLGAA
jgi:hypothetical protein